MITRSERQDETPSVVIDVNEWRKALLKQASRLWRYFILLRLYTNFDHVLANCVCNGAVYG
eukprot:1186243-Ditylum_brightwellii.AAC.1